MYLCGSITSLAVFVTCYDFSTGSESYHSSKFVRAQYEVTIVLSLIFFPLHMKSGNFSQEFSILFNWYKIFFSRYNL